MVRDTTEGKINYLSVRFGPMFRRWADHLTKGRVKYPDTSPGTPNWTLAEGIEEYLRAKDSAARHFEAWLTGERDEDHAAGLYFNVNVAEYVLEVAEARGEKIDPGLGAKVVMKTTSLPPPARLLSTNGIDVLNNDHLSVEEEASAVPRPCVSCACRSPHCHTGLPSEWRAPHRGEVISRSHPNTPCPFQTFNLVNGAIMRCARDPAHGGQHVVV